MKVTIAVVIAFVAICSGHHTFISTEIWGTPTSNATLHVVKVEKVANPYNFLNIHLDFPEVADTNNRTILGIKQVDYVHPVSKVELTEGGVGANNASFTIFAACGVGINSTFTFYLA